MRSSFLEYTWKGISGYSYGYVLISKEYSVEDIIASSRKVVLFGWRPDVIPAKNALEHNGIKIDCVCDFNQPLNVNGRGYQYPIRHYRELLKENRQNYYFIIVLKDDSEIDAAKKMIQYAGYDEFGIVYGDYTKDFQGRKKLQKACFDSVNEVFEPFDFLYNKVNLHNIRTASLSGMGYWDIPFMMIYDLYRRKSSQLSNTEIPKYLEIGLGIGIMSLSLKKLLDIDITWIVLPDDEIRWKEAKNDNTQEILKKYNIKTITGYIETDSFDGQYDIIVMAQVMEHLVFNPVNTFRKLAHLLKDNGYLFISVPEEFMRYNVQNFHEIPYPHQLTDEERNRRVLINELGHFHEYSHNEAMDVFRESGFECVAHQWTFPVHHYMLRKYIPEATGSI